MIIPDFGFITRILNIKESDIQSPDTVFRDNVAYYYLELKKFLRRVSVSSWCIDLTWSWQDQTDQSRFFE